MSICRFSSDDFMCDLYIYEDVAGCITVHTAGSRLTKPLNIHESFEYSVYHMQAYRQPIDHPKAGKTFSCNGEEAIALVKELIAAGFSCPDYVIDYLEAIKGDYP